MLIEIIGNNIPIVTILLFFSAVYFALKIKKVEKSNQRNKEIKK